MIIRFNFEKKFINKHFLKVESYFKFNFRFRINLVLFILLFIVSQFVACVCVSVCVCHFECVLLLVSEMIVSLSEMSVIGLILRKHFSKFFIFN